MGSPVNLHYETARKLARMTRQAEFSARPSRRRRRDERMFLPGGGLLGSVATVEVVIPGAIDDDTPGGPVTATRRLFDSGSMIDGDEVQVWSWVSSDSADPAGQPSGKLRIFIEQDENDTDVWWFTGQDCTETPAEVLEADASSDLIVSTTLAKVPGTELVVGVEGLYAYSLEAEIEVVGVPGNQAWDLDIGLYDETDSAWLRAWDWTGAGDPLTNPRLNVSWNANVSSAIAGHTVSIWAIRATTTGTVTILAEDPPGVPVTGHSLLGPIK